MNDPAVPPPPPEVLDFEKLVAVAAQVRGIQYVMAAGKITPGADPGKEKVSAFVKIEGERRVTNYLLTALSLEMLKLTLLGGGQ